MKKIISIFIALCFSTQIIAHEQGCLLKIRDAAERDITVELNGRRYDKIGKVVVIGDLPQGFHKLKIYTINRYRNNNNANARLIYSGRISIRNNYIYYITVDGFEKLDIIEDCCLEYNNAYTRGNDWYKSRYYDKQEWERDYQFDPQRDNYYYKNKGNGNRNNPDRKDNWSQYNRVMSQAQFNTLIEQVRDASFESNRMDVIKQATQANNINTQQLKSILGELSFESSRLEMAKFAYPFVVDKENLFQINSAFSFSSSKDEFNKFLQMQRN